MDPSTSTDQQPIQLSFPLPRSLDTKVHLRLTIQAKAITLFLTTVATDDVGNPVPIGSLVYSLPDVSYHQHSLPYTSPPPTPFSG